MAIDLTAQPWKFDAVNQTYARDAASTVGNANSLSARQRIFINTIVFETAGTAGDFEVLDSSGGKSITGKINVAADSQFQYVIDQEVEGIFIGTIPASATIWIWHGEV